MPSVVPPPVRSVVPPPVRPQQPMAGRAGTASSKSLNIQMERQMLPGGRVRGRLVKWNGKCGWILPYESVSHPAGSKWGGRIYLAQEDVDTSVLLEGGDVSFFIYSDSSGLGAAQCCSADAQASAARAKRRIDKAQTDESAHDGSRKSSDTAAIPQGGVTGNTDVSSRSSIVMKQARRTEPPWRSGAQHSYEQRGSYSMSVRKADDVARERPVRH